MGKLIFLDIDGVLRRTTSPATAFDRDCLEYFESAVRQCPVSRIVITSTWRHAMSLKELRSRFSSDIAARIVGVTPENLEPASHERHAEILAFLEQKNLKAMPWVAIDDDPDYFPESSPVIYTDPQKGFDACCGERLAQSLLENGAR